MTLGHAVRESNGTWSSFVATDTRVRFCDGTFEDPGGKVVNVGSGWATGAGSDLQAFEASVAALRNAGPIPIFTDNAGVQWPACDVQLRAEEIISGALDAYGQDPPKNHVLLIEPRYGVVAIQRGKAREMSIAGDWPADLAHEEPVRYSAMRESIVEAGNDLAARICAAAFHFADAARVSTDMSSTMEIGYIIATRDGFVRGFLRGEADEIASSNPVEIFERFQAEPADKLPRELMHAKWAADATGTRLSATGTVLGSQIDPGTVGPTQTVSRNRVGLWISAAQSIPNATATTAILFDSEFYDVGGMHSTVSNKERIVIPAGGLPGAIDFSADIEWAANATGRREVTIYKNAATIMASVRVLGFSSGGFGPRIVLPAKDSDPAAAAYYWISVYQDSGAALNVINAFFYFTHQW